METKLRDPLFDLAKAFAMFFVVFGHVGDTAELFNGAVYNFGIGFKMPLFFLISGYFLWNTVSSGNWRKLYSHMKTYFLPLIWISLCFAIFSFAIGTVKGGPSELIKWGAGFFLNQWFVWALAASYGIAFLVCRIVVNPKLRVLALAIAYLVFMALPFPYAREMFIYFLLGCVAKASGTKIWERWYVCAVSVVAYLAVILFEGDAHVNGMGFYFTDTSIKLFMSVNGVLMYLGRHALGIVGSLAVMSSIYLFKTYVPKIGCLSVFGTTTLGVYLLHQQMIKVFARFGWLNGELAVVLLSCGLFVGCHVLTWFTRERIGITRRIVWGFDAVGRV